MAIISPPWMVQGGSHDAKNIRQSLAATFGAPVQTFTGGIQPTDGGGAHGVLGDDDLKVTEADTPGMKIKIAAGTAVATGTSVLAEGAVPFVNDADFEADISVGDATNDRHDLIVVQKQENTVDSSGEDRGRATVIVGTPAASPADPAIPAGCLVLARVVVPANEATSITDSDITDLRTYAATVGGVQRCTSTTRPTGVSLYEGLVIREMDTGRRLEWDGSNWLPLLGGWVAVQSVTAKSVPNNVNTSINGLSDVHDPNGWAGSGGITPDVEGYYLVTANTEWEIMPAASRLLHQVFVGGQIVAGVDGAAGPGTSNKSMVGVGYCDGSSHSILVQAFQSSGSTRTVDLRLSAHLIARA